MTTRGALILGLVIGLKARELRLALRDGWGNLRPYIAGWRTR